jgi:hypothetical protein
MWGWNLRCVRALQIFVQAISLRDQLLFPMSEPLFFNLDLLRESLPQTLFLFLKLGVIQFSRSGLTKLSRLHLLSTVCFIVLLLGGVNEIEHMSADENRAELFEVAVVFILNLGDAPGILTTLDNATICGLHILLGANNGKWHCSHEAAGMESCVFIILLDRWLINLDALSVNNGSNLKKEIIVST